MSATGAASGRSASSFAPWLKSLVVMMRPCSCAPNEPRTCCTTGFWTFLFQRFACTAMRMRTASPTTRVPRTSMPPSPELLVTSTSGKSHRRKEFPDEVFKISRGSGTGAVEQRLPDFSVLFLDKLGHPDG